MNGKLKTLLVAEVLDMFIVVRKISLLKLVFKILIIVIIALFLGIKHGERTKSEYAIKTVSYLNRE